MKMRPNRSRIRIVRLGDPREYLRTELVQRDAWGIEPADIIIPFHMMIAAQHHGGLVLGADDGRKTKEDHDIRPFRGRMVDTEEKSQQYPTWKEETSQSITTKGG